MADIQRSGLVTSLNHLFGSAKYSDLTIKCGADEFKLHRAIVCLRSKFFAAACDGQFQVDESDVENRQQNELLQKKLVRLKGELAQMIRDESTSDFSSFSQALKSTNRLHRKLKMAHDSILIED